MNYSLRRLLSCMLAAVILSTSFDMSVFAAQNDASFDEATEVIAASEMAETETTTEAVAEPESKVEKVVTVGEEKEDMEAVAEPATYSVDMADWSIRWKESEEDTWDDHVLSLACSHIYDFKDEYRYYLFSNDHMITQEEYRETPITIDNNGTYIVGIVGDDSTDEYGGVYLTVDKSKNYEPVARFYINFAGIEDHPYVYFIGAIVRYTYTDVNNKSHTLYGEGENVTISEGLCKTVNMYIVTNPFEKITVTHDDSDSITVANDLNKSNYSTYFNINAGGETTFHLTYKLNGCAETVEKDFEVTITPTPVSDEEIDADNSLLWNVSPYRPEEGVDSPSEDEMKKHDAGYPIIGVIGFERKYHSGGYEIEQSIKNAVVSIDGVEYATLGRKDWFYSNVSSSGDITRVMFHLGFIPESVVTAGKHTVTVRLGIDAPDKSVTYRYSLSKEIDFTNESLEDVNEFFFDYEECETYMPEKDNDVEIYKSVAINGVDGELVLSQLVWDEGGEVLASSDKFTSIEKNGVDPRYGITGEEFRLFSSRLPLSYVGISRMAIPFIDHTINEKDIKKDGYVNAVFTSKSGKRYVVKHVMYLISQNTDKVIVDDVRFVDGTTARDNSNLGYLMPDNCGNYLSVYVYKGRNYTEETIPTFYSDSECTKPVTSYDESDAGCIVERDPYHPEYIYYTVKKNNPDDACWGKMQKFYILLEGMDKANVIAKTYRPNPIQGAMIVGDSVRIYLSPEYVEEGGTYSFQTGQGFGVTQEATVYRDTSGLYAEFTGEFERKFKSYNRVQIQVGGPYDLHVKYNLPDSMSYDTVGSLSVPVDMAKWELHSLTVMGSPIASGEAEGGAGNVLSQEMIDELALSGDIFRVCYRDSDDTIKHWRFVKFRSSKVMVTYLPNGGTFVADNGEALEDSRIIKTVAEGDNYSFPRVEKNPGYELKGWYTKPEGGERIDESGVIGEQDITLYAQWEAKTYTLEFNLDDRLTGRGTAIGSINPITVHYDEEISLPNNIKLEGYDLEAWATLSFDELSRKYQIVNEYKTGIKQVNIWDGEAEETRIVLYPVWTAKKYKITYAFASVNNPLGIPQGKAYDNFTAEESLVFGMPEAIEGYEFAWYSDSRCTKPVTSTEGLSLKDTTVYGKWTPVRYSIEFNPNADASVLNGAVVNPIRNLAYDKKVKLNKNKYARNDGYYFYGWSTTTDGMDESGAEAILKNQQTVSKLSSVNNATVTLYAVWKPVSYKITYKNTKNVNVAELRKNYTVLDGEIALQVPVIAGYTLEGWYTNKNYKADTKITSFEAADTKKNLTVYAKWTTNKYNVVFDKNFEDESEDNTMDTIVCDYARAYKLPANSFSRDGCVFVGWNTAADGSGVTYLNRTSVKNLSGTDGADVTLYAQWTNEDELQYTIKLAGTGADATSNPMADVTVKYGEKKKLPGNTYSKKYYTFAGWTDNERLAGTVDTANVKYANKSATSIILPKSGAKEITLYPVWKPVDYKLTVTGTKGAAFGDIATKDKCSVVMNVTDGMMILPAMSKVGYAFEGYYLDQRYTKPVKVVNYDSDDEEQATVIYESEELTEDLCTSPKKQTIYAKWKPVAYRISFADAESDPAGTVMNAIDVTYDKARKLPANVYKKTGMTFMGWNYYNESNERYEILKNKANVKNLSNEAGAVVKLDAVWAPAKCKLMYMDNGATNAEKIVMRPVLAKNGTKVKLATNYYEKEGSKFIGWSTDAEWTEESGYVLYRPGQVVTSFYEKDNIITSEENNGYVVYLYAIWQ